MGRYPEIDEHVDRFMESQGHRRNLIEIRGGSMRNIGGAGIRVDGPFRVEVDGMLMENVGIPFSLDGEAVLKARHVRASLRRDGVDIDENDSSAP